MADEYGPTPDALVALIRRVLIEQQFSSAKQHDAEAVAATLRANPEVVLRALSEHRVPTGADKAASHDQQDSE